MALIHAPHRIDANNEVGCRPDAGLVYGLEILNDWGKELQAKYGITL